MNRFFFSFLLIVGNISLAFAQPLLKGELTQGSLIRGSLPNASIVWLNDKKIAVSPSGDFVFGFGRDATLNHQLKWQLSDGSTSQMPLVIKKREYDTQRIEGVAQKYVSPPSSVTQRIRSDNQKIGKARSALNEWTYFTDNFTVPAQGRVSGVYGSQRIFNGVPKRPHFGLDIAGPVGTQVVAPAKGKVTLWEPDMYYSGGTMIIDHGYGVTSTFIHLSASLVEQGDIVEQGQAVAEIGATGRVTGPHLDWRINWFKERLDPNLLISPRITQH